MLFWAYNAPTSLDWRNQALATAPSGNPPLRFGVFELDAVTGELRKSGHTIRLRPQAAKILVLLASRPGQLITREELREKVWGNETFVDFDHGLNLCIREVRAALDDDEIGRASCRERV